MKKLQKHHKMKRKGPLVLVIMDGVGLGPENKGNAFYLAKTPALDSLLAKSFHTILKAHGKAVGLPSDNDMGNSEVGHNALGAGRIFFQGAKLVSEAIQTGSIFSSSAWQQAILRPQQKRTTLHFIGLLSDGNVHSHQEHLFKMISQAAQEGVKKVRVHILLDGRDVAEKSALLYVDKLESLLEIQRASGFDYRIASGGGRMITTMDRYEADWEIVKRGWQAHVLGEATPFKSAKKAIEFYRGKDPNLTDQYLPPFTIVDDKGPVGLIQDNDSVLLFNFRGDRAIEISRAFTEDNFKKFDRKRFPKLFFAGMMQYDGDLKIPPHYLVAPPKIDHTISEYLVASQINQLAISETQKFGHVTYFWNGNRSGKFDEKLETYLEIPSDKIEFNQKPAMKASEITDEVVQAIELDKYDFIRINFPNGDMVGHTGDLKAAIIAVQEVDKSIERIITMVKKKGGIAVITADHGNLEEMFEIDKKTGQLNFKDGSPKKKTAHTLNPVPFIIYDPEFKNEYSLKKNNSYGLANVAATLLTLLGFEPPAEYEPSLIELN
jgi:2,3-bisphosphoglycerate-independent phosphoglycerate mutase